MLGKFRLRKLIHHFLKSFRGPRIVQLFERDGGFIGRLRQHCGLRAKQNGGPQIIQQRLLDLSARRLHIAAHHLRWRAWPFFAYAVCVLFSIMYLGEHYAVDLFAGIGLALFCFALFYPVDTRLARERLGALRERLGRPPESASILRPALLALLLFAFAEAGEKLATEYQTSLWIHPRFVERELAHLPGAEDLFLANDAYDHGDVDTAVHHYERALPLLDAPHRSRVRQALARSTHALERRMQPPVAFQSNAPEPATVR